MPIYCFSCPDCGEKFEKTLSIKDCMKSQKCKCGKKADRDLIAEHCSGGIDSQMREYRFDGDNGCRMYAASYLDLAEAKRVHKTTDFIWHNECWIPRIKHATHRKQYLKEMNYVDKG